MFFKHKETGVIVDAIILKRQMALEGQVIQAGTLMYFDDAEKQLFVIGPIEFDAEYDMLENQNDGLSVEEDPVKEVE